MKHSQATVRVPATSANLGPGFDCFGVALQLTNELSIHKKDSPKKLPKMMEETANRFFSTVESDPFPFSVEITGDIPPSRGLGSSATVRLGILLALNELTNHPLATEQLYTLASDLEDHADNVAAALLGGFTIARPYQAPLRYELSSELQFVLLIPDFSVSTKSARSLLPNTISITDAATNAANAAVVAVAFATGKYELLRGAFHDRLHQPFREPLIPYLSEALGAAESSGALGGWLSGSGSTIIALAENKKVSASVVEAFEQIAPSGSYCCVTQVDNLGAKVLPQR